MAKYIPCHDSTNATNYFSIVFFFFKYSSSERWRQDTFQSVLLFQYRIEKEMFSAIPSESTNLHKNSKINRPLTNKLMN